MRTLVVEDETTAAGILATARREHADLVVLGKHGRGNLADRILGATTSTVTHRASDRAAGLATDCSVREA